MIMDMSRFHGHPCDGTVLINRINTLSLINRFLATFYSHDASREFCMFEYNNSKAKALAPGGHFDHRFHKRTIKYGYYNLLKC